LLCHGFVRVRCRDCGDDKLVAFSCQRRGFCPSCCGRRMADTAAHLVDRVFPERPTRQWVLTLPIPLRYRVAYDRNLCSDVLGVFIRTVSRSLRRRAKRHLGIDCGQSGSVTQIQRWGGAANLNVHYHAVFLDGVYADPENTGAPEFYPCPPRTIKRSAALQPPAPGASSASSNVAACSRSMAMPPRTRCRTKSRYSPHVPRPHCDTASQRGPARASR
jgi:hypothetical protein